MQEPTLTPEVADEKSELAIKFHMHVFSDKQLMRSLNRLWVEFGSDIYSVFGSDASFGLGPDHLFGRWMDGVSQTVARVYEERHPESPF